MSYSHGLSKAVLYLNQNRFAEAEKELRQHLSQAPEDADALAMLATCLAAQKQLDTALTLNEQAIGLQPANDRFLFQRSSLLFQAKREPEALQLLDQAIQLNPIEADYFGMRGQLKMTMKDYEGALAAANQGLALEADNTFCLNVRAQALVKLKRPDEAYDTIATSLENEPENSYTHTNLGWTLLENNKHKQALEHFREALRLDPSNEYARGGMVEALKAQNVFYRLFLRYVFWMNRMSAQYQWAFIIGIYVAYRVLLSVSRNNPDLAPIIQPLLYAYIAFALSTWFFEPISNLFLFTNPYGRYALSQKERQSARWVGGSLLLGLLILAAYFATDNEGLLFGALGFIALMIPLSAMFKGRDKRGKRFLMGSAIGLGAVLLIALAAAITNQHDLADMFYMILFLGVFFYSFAANYFAGPRY